MLHFPIYLLQTLWNRPGRTRSFRYISEYMQNKNVILFLFSVYSSDDELEPAEGNCNIIA